jgi:hypothetical protein
LTNAVGARWVYVAASGIIFLAAGVALKYTRGIKLELAQPTVVPGP